MNRPNQLEARFIRFLEERLGVSVKSSGDREIASDQRAARAALRRGLGKPAGLVADMYPYVEPWLEPSAPRRRVEDFYLVASLMAWHPLSWREDDTPQSATNLGASLLRLAQTEREQHGEVPAGLERRLMAMLNASREDLPDHLRRVVGLLKGSELPVNWEQLLADLRAWEWTSREVQRRWAHSFWGQIAASEEQQASKKEAEENAG